MFYIPWYAGPKYNCKSPYRQFWYFDSIERRVSYKRPGVHWRPSAYFFVKKVRYSVSVSKVLILFNQSFSSLCVKLDTSGADAVRLICDSVRSKLLSWLASVSI